MELKSFLKNQSISWGENPNQSVEGRNSFYSNEVFPVDEKELKSLLKYLYREEVSYDVVSTGFNWGLGAKWTPKDVLINLSKFQKVIKVDEEFGLVTISPSVSQVDLADYLKYKGLPFFIDVTGSSKHSSIVGNLMERGIAYNSQRVEKVKNLKVMLPDGDQITSGYGLIDENTRLKVLYPYGVGPDIMGLFFQSEFGIVTEATMQLERIPEDYVSLQFTFSSYSELEQAIPHFKKLSEEGILNGIPHIANEVRYRTSVFPAVYKYFLSEGRSTDIDYLNNLLGKFFQGDWSGFGLVSGSSASLGYRVRRVKKLLGSSCQIKCFKKSTLEFLNRNARFFTKIDAFAFFMATMDFRSLTFGVPTDESLGCLMSPERFADSDKEFAQIVPGLDQGYLYFLPIAPFSESGCSNLVELCESVCQDFGFRPAITLNPLNEFVLEAVISLSFDKQESYRAHRCLDELKQRYKEKGIYPYRWAKFDEEYRENAKKMIQLIQKIAK